MLGDMEGEPKLELDSLGVNCEHPEGRKGKVTAPIFLKTCYTRYY